MKYKNITGLYIGNSYIIKEEPKKKGRIHWRVRCICGKERILDTGNANKGKLCNSCCQAMEKPYRRKRPFEYQYNNFVHRAKYNVSIKYEDYLVFTEQKKCHYCDAEIKWSSYHVKGIGGGSNLDRKDNDVGYTKENSVVCCGRCNYAKGSHFSYEEWIEIGKIIKSFKERNFRLTPQSNNLSRTLIEKDMHNNISDKVV